MSRLESTEPANPYERRQPGELVHLDIKKLTRFVRAGHRVTGRGVRGWRGQLRQGVEYAHVAIDDYRRVAYVELLNNQQGGTCAAFLAQAIAGFAGRGVHIERVLSDNGPGYCSALSPRSADAITFESRGRGPYRSRTNGKAERFIQTICAIGPTPDSVTPADNAI